ncbi:MAG: hypothetical protein ABF575_09235 [Liquorilactobacillus hordei]|uniref:hypothetical protein n=1 Tax=Liquorilactobacillus hordei TaxID=468911 RepID=UPI0039ECBB34
MKKSIWFRTILVALLLIILWISNQYDFLYHNLVGYILIICGVFVGVCGDSIDQNDKNRK